MEVVALQIITSVTPIEAGVNSSLPIIAFTLEWVNFIGEVFEYHVANTGLIKSLTLLFAGLYITYVVLSIVRAFLLRLWRSFFPLPETQFGFRGKLLYADTGKDSDLLVDRRSGAVSKPDFIYELSDGRKAIFELKSRSFPMASDFAQLEVGAVAARSKFNITTGGVTLKDGTVVWDKDLTKSNAKLLRKHRKAITNVIRYKQGRKLKHSKSADCARCPQKSHCKGELHV